MSRINPWEHKLAPKVNWKTKSNYFVWLRGQLRRIWADNPLRKEWKKQQLRPVTKEEKSAKKFHTSTKNVGQCYLCKKWFAGSKLECDHVQESNGCYDFETAEQFLWHCGADDPSNWALACKPCHKIKSYADKQGISFEDAKVEKEVIALTKKSIADQKKLLSFHGFQEEDMSNNDKRRDCFRELIRGGYDL